MVKRTKKGLEILALLYLILILRILDLHSTYLCVEKYGIYAEGNILPRFMMERLGIYNYLGFNLILSMLFLIIAGNYWNKSKIVRLVAKIFLVLNIFVVINNYYCFLI